MLIFFKTNIGRGPLLNFFEIFMKYLLLHCCWTQVSRRLTTTLIQSWLVLYTNGPFQTDRTLHWLCQDVWRGGAAEVTRQREEDEVGLDIGDVREDLTCEDITSRTLWGRVDCWSWTLRGREDKWAWTLWGRGDATAGHEIHEDGRTCGHELCEDVWMLQFEDDDGRWCWRWRTRS